VDLKVVVINQHFQKQNKTYQFTNKNWMIFFLVFSYSIVKAINILHPILDMNGKNFED
jgi:hypothetical protein